MPFDDSTIFLQIKFIAKCKSKLVYFKVQQKSFSKWSRCFITKLYILFYYEMHHLLQNVYLLQNVAVKRPLKIKYNT